MKKTIAIVSSCLFLVSACAGQHRQHPQHRQQQPARHQSQSMMINLYAQPDFKAQVVEKVHIGQPLVPIFHQHGWEKVANRHNGNVGWVNVKQYRHTLQQAMQPDIQTVYIQREKVRQGQKPQMTIVAYRNGKKVSDQEAKAIYHRIRHQENMQQRQWMQFDRDMDRQMRFMDQQFAHFPMMMPMWQPVIVVHDR